MGGDQVSTCILTVLFQPVESSKMWITLHAICLLALPAITLAICLLAKRRKPTGEQAVISAIISGGLAFLVLSVLGSHLCSAGKPTAQCVIIGACVWFLLTYLNALVSGYKSNSFSWLQLSPVSFME